MRLLRKILGGISLTAAMFVFQACYGTEPDCPLVDYTFHVVDDKDGTPIPDIRVSSQWQSNSGYEYDWDVNGFTDSAGIAQCSFWACGGLNIKVRFSDADSVYVVKDTILNQPSGDTIDILLSRVNE